MAERGSLGGSALVEFRKSDKSKLDHIILYWSVLYYLMVEHRVILATYTDISLATS